MKFEFSAGGIVYKKENNTIVILMGQHAGHHGWVFPKGLIGDHPSAVSKQGIKETKEEAALREVQEETGALGKIIHPLLPLSFWYQWQGEKRKKTVYYYVMEYLNGDISKHDMEMEKVEWVPFNDVENKLTYPGDKEVWTEAKTFLIQNKC